MRSRRIGVAIALALVGVLLLGACDTVKGKRVRGGQYQLLVENGEGKRRWVNVTAGDYANCEKGSEWPSCGEGYGNGVQDRPAAEREQREEEKTRNKKSCDRTVQVVASWSPDVFMRVKWAIEDRKSRDGETRTQHRGAFSRTRENVCPGGFAYIRISPEAASPDLANCLIRVNGSIVTAVPPSDNGACNAKTVIP